MRKRRNLPIFGIKNKDLREFCTTEKDLEKGVSRIPLNLSRLYEEDLLDEKGEFIVGERKKNGVAGMAFDFRGGTVVGEICNTEEMEQFEEIIEHRQSAYNNSSGVKNNSYGEDKATDDEE
jgi:hypothetical protein